MSILRSLTLAAGVALLSSVPATAAVHLPTVQRTLSASSASASCKGSSSATTTYTAPLAGFLTARLRAAGGEWDLYLADAQSRTSLSQSRAFGSTEVTQTWVSAGQKVLVSACRTAGSVSQATVSFDFVDAVKPGKVMSSTIRIGRVSRATYAALEAAGFDITHNVKKDYIEIFLEDGAKLAEFKKLGIPFKVRFADMQAVDAKARNAEAARARSGAVSLVPTGRTAYRFLADYQAEMADIVAKNPTIARAVTIGYTYQGRPIQGVELSHDVNATDDGKPTFLLTGVHHAREWPSSETALEFMHLLTGKGASDADLVKIADLLDKERILIVPILNIDGFVSSRGESAAQAQIGAIPDPNDEILGSGSTDDGGSLEPGIGGGAFAYRRKNCDAAVAQAAAGFDNAAARSMPCYYAYGVDPNRNYGFDWGGPGASTDPTAQTFRGTAQWSEPENQALWHYAQAHPVTTFVTMHTIAALVLRSPGLHTNGLAPDETLLKELGDKMAKFTGYTSQYGWQLYDTTGTAEDWNYGAAGTLGYTIEIGPAGGVFHGNYKVAVEDQWVGRRPKPNQNKPLLGGMHDALLTAAAYGIDPRSHSVISGSGAPGATLTLDKSFKTDSSPPCTFAEGFPVGVNGVNDKLDCVAPGTLPVTSADDGLHYTTKVRPDGTFTWHVTQSTRPFKGYTYDPATGLPKPNGTTESWTLACNGKSTTFTIERGETKDLGAVCA